MYLSKKSPEETYLMINEIITVQEKRMAQLNVSPEAGEELPESSEANPPHLETNHTFRLRARPTKRNTIPNGPNQTTLITHMSVKEGIRRFRNKGNEALIKELNQLHERQSLLPKKGRGNFLQGKEKGT